jgi:phosphatidylglycerophosphatase C
MISNDVAKQRVLARFFAGTSIDTLRNKAEFFAEQALPGLIRPEAARRVAWHKQQGHRCIVISASLEFYVRHWALNNGIADMLASRLEVQADGRVTGKLLGENCYGGEKVRRLEELLGADPETAVEKL